MVRFVGHGIMLDDIVYPDGKTQMGVLGGGGPQSAWGMAAALGRGQDVGMIAGIHEDEKPDVLKPLTEAGINIDGIRWNEMATPRAWQVLEDNSLRRHVWRVPTEILPYQLERGWRVAPISYRQAEFFHWGIHPDDAELDIEWAHTLVKNGIKVCLEPFRPPAEPMTLDELHRLLAPCRVFSVNLYEAMNITGMETESDMLDVFRKANCQYLLVRRDVNGSDAWNLMTGKGVHVPAVKTNVLDVVGAGNAYTGAFLARFELDGLAESAAHGSVAASYMIEQVGLPMGLPDPVDYEKRLSVVRDGLVELSR